MPGVLWWCKTRDYSMQQYMCPYILCYGVTIVAFYHLLSCYTHTKLVFRILMVSSLYIHQNEMMFLTWVHSVANFEIRIALITCVGESLGIDSCVNIHITLRFVSIHEYYLYVYHRLIGWHNVNEVWVGVLQNHTQTYVPYISFIHFIIHHLGIEKHS